MPDAWHWLTRTDAGLAARVAAAALFFLCLALADLRRNGRRATRWREYAFLLATAALAMAYGVANDQLTSRLSWEYFYYGKELSPVLGPNTPPDPAALSWQAVAIGLKATWTVGLLMGVALLLANNPKPGLPRLPYSRLLRRIPFIALGCVVSAATLGVIGYLGGLAWLFEDFRQMIQRDEFRPYRFMAVFGIHLGGYIGGAVGTVWAVVCVRRERWARRAKAL